MAGIFAFFRYRAGPTTPQRGRKIGDDPAGTVAVEEWREMMKDDTTSVLKSELEGQLTAIRSELVGVRSLLTTISGSLERMNGSIAQALRDK